MAECDHPSMMPATDRDLLLGELVEPLVRSWRRILLAAAAVTAVTALLGGIYYVRQSTLSTFVVTFRPTFDEATIDQYPGRQPFALGNILQPSIIDRSVRRLGADHYCGGDDVGADLRGRYLTPLYPPSDEVRVTRPIFQLVFEPRGACAGLPDDLALKLLSGILAEWASDAVERRGVLQLSAAIITPEIFTHTVDSPIFVRAERVREAILRVDREMAQFKEQPGAEFVRLSDLTLDMLQFRLESVMGPLDRLIVTSIGAAGAADQQWLTDALAAAEIEQRRAQQEAESLRVSLHEYAAMTPDEASLKNPATLDSRESFKQELARSYVKASVRASRQTATVDRYRTLRAAITTQRGIAPPPAVLERTLAALVRDAGAITADFNRLYKLFSQTRVGDQGLLYRIEQGPEAAMVKPFTFRSLMLLLIGVAFGSAALIAGVVLLRSHWRWLLQGEPARSNGAE